MSFKDRSVIDIKKDKNPVIGQKSIIISLFVIGTVAFLLRVNFVTFDLPITLDALAYFWYAIDMSQLGIFPSGYTNISNNGWPSFLSLFFSLYHSSNFLDYMTLQRIITMTISVLTLVPIFLLCRRFVNDYFAVFGAAIFVFEPRIIQNSLLGVTEPLFILLVTLTILFFLKERISFVYLAFAISSIAVLVRIEGLALLIALSIGYFWKFRKKRTDLAKYGICLSVIILVLVPIMIIRIDTSGEDGIISRLSYSSTTLSQNAINRGIESGSSNQLIILGLENFVKFLGWSMIPTFLVFVPYGYLLLIKQRNFEKNFIILTSIILIFPIIYALSVASDTRYLFPLYPIFCITAVISFKYFSEKLGNKKILIVLALSAILISSVAYLDYKKIDTEHEKEALELAKTIASKTNRINLYPPESQYLAVNELYKMEKFPLIRSEFMIPYQSVDYGWPIFKSFNSINEAMEYFSDNSVTHLVIDNNKINLGPLNEAFINEEKFPFLEKIYDSAENGYSYHLKVFKINYELLGNNQD